MNCTFIAENHLADRYVMGQLTAEETERFEDHTMSCDTCLDEIDRAEVMARGFKRVGAEETAKAVMAVASVGWWQRRRQWLPTAAAIVMTGLALAIFLPRTPWDTEDPGAKSSSRVNTPVVYLQPERSSEAPPSRQLRLPTDHGPVVLVLELDPPHYPSYSAVVERSGREIWNGAGLELGERDSVTLSLGAGLLAPGDHLLRLGATTFDGQQVSVGHFGFHVFE